MKIETQFDVGQQVWVAGMTYRDGQCPSCEGTGDVPGKDGKLIECSRCEGSGTITMTIYEPKWRKIEQVTVRAVVERQVEEYSFGFMHPYNGSTKYATQDEAQAECDRLNAKE